MIEMITAYTEEVDEINDGIEELLGQIDMEALKKNSVGLITCHIDFTSSAFISELCKKLPFNVIGMSTLASANKHGQSMYALSLTVLSSDDVVFETAMAGSLNAENYLEKLKSAYSAAAGKLPGKPAMIMTFFPFINEVNGAELHKGFDSVCGGIPFWGSIASNFDGRFDKCTVFHNAEIDKTGLAMILIHGPVDPEFVVVSLPGEKIGKNLGQITKSDGCILYEINGMTAQKYLETLGVIVREDAPIYTPLMVYYEGSPDPVALGMYAVHADGSFLCGGEMPVGALITIGEITSEGILATTGDSVDRLLGANKRNGALFLPCITRYLMLSPSQSDEMNLVISKIGDSIPFMIGYAGGEICPVRDEAGALRNRFHNFTFTVCGF